MTKKNSMNWVTFALMTVAFWGLYGVFLHKGAMGMADPQFGRYKAFLVVGIAYFLVAVLAPLILLKMIVPTHQCFGMSHGFDVDFHGLW